MKTLCLHVLLSGFVSIGGRVMLVVFLVEFLGFDKARAMVIFHFFLAIQFAMQLFTGYLADRVLGGFWTLFFSRLVNCLGFFALAFWTSEWGLGPALFCWLITGLSVVTALFGEQYKDPKKRASVFSWYYWVANLSGILGALVAPKIFSSTTPSNFYLIFGFVALANVVLLLLGKRFIRDKPVQGRSETVVRPILKLFYLRAKTLFRESSEVFWNARKGKAEPVVVQNAQVMLFVASVFGLLSFFWALYMQHESSWILQGSRMETSFWGFSIQPAQISAANPILVILFIPFLQKYGYPWLKKLGFELNTRDKIAWGLVFTVIAFLCSALIDWFIDAGVSLSILFQLIPHTWMALAEVFVAVSGLDFAHERAPERLKAVVMSFWCLSIAGGNLFTGAISALNIMQGAWEFAFYAGCVAVVTGFFLRLTASAYSQKTTD